MDKFGAIFVAGETDGRGCDRMGKWGRISRGFYIGYLPDKIDI